MAAVAWLARVDLALGGGDTAAARHWAFEPVRPVEAPADPSGWAVHPVDRFIAARLRSEGLQPVSTAGRRALIRRACCDLIGLPPEPAEVEAFVADASADAFENLVNRLLASPHFGERQGRHWMDVVRYADTAGDNADYPVPEARLYRDYIIDAFNADKPYDRFVEEQLAGDILASRGEADHGRDRGAPDCRAEQIVATGFIALSRRYATAPFELMHLTLEDTIETTGRAFLGLTLRCARCHDHKFDPVTMQDYYGLYGIFSSTRYPYAGSEELASKSFGRSGFVSLAPPDEARAGAQAHAEKIRKLAEEVQKLEEEAKAAGKDAGPADALKARQTELGNLRRSNLPPGAPCAYAVEDEKPADARVQTLGDPAQAGPAVPRGAIKRLLGDKPLEIPPGSSGRLELARWLTRPENPLTARVMVNRIWQHLFGHGIVASPSTFGSRGDPPSHPELLDWLAARFVESGWSMKTVYRLIATSKTYQLSCDDDEVGLVRDPANRWCWRHDRRRLDAEALRDAMLSVSGLLELGRAGEHPFPQINAWGWTQHNPFKAVYPSNHRTVYLMTQRLQKHPFLALFDGPDTNSTADARTSSIVPQQALFLRNNPFAEEAAAAFARRLIALPGPAALRIETAYELAFCRPPETMEVQKGIAFADRCALELAKAGAPQDRIELEAWASYARVLFASNELLFVD